MNTTVLSIFHIWTYLAEVENWKYGGKTITPVVIAVDCDVLVQLIQEQKGIHH